MRVLLVCTNRERHPFPVAPLGALFVARAARQAGHQVDVLDLGFAWRPEHALRAALRRSQADVVGFSIRNLDNCYFIRPHSYVDDIAPLAQVVRRFSSASLVLGGSGFSMAPRQWMRRLDADYGIVGEGESAFTALLRDLEAGTPPAPSRNLLTRHGLTTSGAAAARGVIARPAEVGSPAHEDCQYRRYLSAGGFIGTQTKRGCPFGCIYCVYPQLEGTAFRLREPAAVADEVAGLVRTNRGRFFFFTDSVFNAPREHALEVCRQLIARGAGARWMALCNPVGFDEELARTMQRAGCVGIEFGLDGVTDKMLANLGKPFGPGEIAAALAAAKNADIPFAVHLLFGGPGETLDDLRGTRDFLDRCAPACGVFASIGIRIHPGTRLEAIARQEGRLSADADLFDPVFYVSEGLGGQPLEAVDRLARGRDEWTSPVDWEKTSMRMIQRLINRLGMRPQWRNVRNYGRHMRRDPAEDRSPRA